MSKLSPAERKDLILIALKDAKGEVVTSKALMGLTDSKGSTFYMAMSDLKKQYPTRLQTVKKTDFSEGGYCWKSLAKDIKDPSGKVTQVEPVNRYPASRTEEGYYDPTAIKAMNKVEIDPNISSPLEIGSIYEYSNSSGKLEMYLVLATSDYQATVIPIYYEDHPGCESLHGKSCGTIYYSPDKIYTKPRKYFVFRKTDLLKNEFKVMKDKVAGYILGKSWFEEATKETVEVVKEVPVEVEKIVEVVKEVAVPGACSGSCTSEEEFNRRLEAALDKERAKIYSDILDKVLRRGN